MADAEQNFSFNDLNLDFLELTPPKATRAAALRQVVRIATPIATSKSFRPNAFKAKQLAQRIANCDALVHKAQQLDNLQLQLADFQKSASEIRKLYETEREQRKELQIRVEQLQSCCDELNGELAEKMLQQDQLQAQLDENKGPLEYIDLVLKYLKLVQQLDEDHQLLRQNKSLVTELRKYCESRGRHVPAVARSPKKRTRLQKYEKGVQCELLEEPPASKQLHSQGTQCEQVEVKSEGTQHISTTTTRSTSTSCFIKQRSVGTCFPEPTTLPPLAEMLNDILLWNNVSPLSPISDLPEPIASLPPSETSIVPEKRSVACTSTGTCTVLCNVRRQIDFLPTFTKLKRSQSRSPLQFIYDNVKHEAFSTPCPSPPPIPLAHAPISTSGRVNAQRGLSMLPQLAEMPPDMFTTVWQMAGQMFMGLMYAPSGSNPCRSATGENEALKQQEFNNWLFSLYENMQQKSQENWPSTNERRRSQSPVNISPLAPADILRPEARRNDAHCRAEVGIDRNQDHHIANDLTALSIENSMDQSKPSKHTNIHSPIINKTSTSPFKEPQQIQKKPVRRKKAEPKITSSKRKKDEHRKIRKNRNLGLPATENQISYDCDNVKDSENAECNSDTEQLFIENITNEQNEVEEDTKTAVEFCIELCPISKSNHKLQNSFNILGVDASKEYIKETVEDDAFAKNLSNSQMQISENELTKDASTECIKQAVEDDYSSESLSNSQMQISESEGTEDTKSSDSDHIELNKATEKDRNDLSSNLNGLGSMDLDYNLFGSDSDSEVGCDTNASYSENYVQNERLKFPFETDDAEESDQSDSALIIDEHFTEHAKCSSPELRSVLNTKYLPSNNSAVENKKSFTCSKVEWSAKRNETNISDLIDTTILSDILISDSTNELVNDILSGDLPDISDAKSPLRQGRKRKLNVQSPLCYKYSTRLQAKQTKHNSSDLNQSIENNLDTESSKNEVDSIQLSPTHSEICNDSTQDSDNKGIECVVETNINGENRFNLENELPCTNNNTVSDTIEDSARSDIPEHSITTFDNTEDSHNEETIEKSEPTIPYANNYNTLLVGSDDSPASPVSISTDSQCFFVPCKSIPLELDSDYYPQADCLMDHLINCYSLNDYKIVVGNTSAREQQQSQAIELQLKAQIDSYLQTTHENVDLEATKLAQTIHNLSKKCELIAAAIIDQIKCAPRPQDELSCEVDKVPPKYVGSHIRLILVVLRHLQHMRPSCVGAVLNKIENTLFQCQNAEKSSLSAALNLIQLYLLTIPIHFSTVEENPVRLLMAKILYYYNKQAAPMVYEVLCQYPTTLPHREESSYDRSDALISVIQHVLMSTNYDMCSTDLCNKELLSLLRFQYHFQPYKPSAEEVLSNLVAKLKAGKLTNLKYAFAIFCKRQRPAKVVADVLQMRLVPLVNEYYHTMQQTCEYDERIAALLDSISVIVKPFPLDTDITMYLSIFHRFLNAVERPVIQEAAVLAILRMQRFGHIRCFRALSNFAPNYPLQPLTKNVLKTFIHRKPLKVWKSLLKETARY